MYRRSVYRDGVFVWLVHHFLELVAEPYKSFIAVAWHGEMDFSLDVIPVEGDAAVFLSLPVCVDCVVFAEDGYHVVGAIFSNVLNTEIVNDKQEADWAGDVLPHAWG